MIHDVDVVERAALVIQIDDRAQHQHRSGHRIEEEFDGRVDAALVAPDADQEVHGHQRHFPEHVEQEQVERDEDADQAEFEQDQKREEFLHAVIDMFPGDQHRDGRQSVVSKTSQRLRPSSAT